MAAAVKKSSAGGRVKEFSRGGAQRIGRRSVVPGKMKQCAVVSRRGAGGQDSSPPAINERSIDAAEIDGKSFDDAPDRVDRRRSLFTEWR